jgi:site-specific DNA recombinase
MKVAIYARVSTEEQRERETIQIQLEFARKFCELHNHKIVSVYADDGVSGTVPTERRPEGSRMLDAARSKQFEAVLVYRIDRMARSVLSLLQTVESLESYGVGVQSMTEPFETATPVGKFMLAMLASIAQLERDTIYERTVNGRERAVRNGKFPGGGAPFGYQVEGERLVIDEAAAEVVRDIFRLYMEGRGTVWIAAHLTSHSVPLPANWARAGATSQTVWYASIISRILNNTTYKGEYRFRKRRVVREDKGTVVRMRRASSEEHIIVPAPPIIDAETFDRVQALARSNRKLSKRRSKREYFLRTLIKCGRCGRNYVGRPSGPRFYYVCASQYAPLINVRWCGNRAVRAERLEQAIWADIREFVRNPGPVLKELTRKLSEERISSDELQRKERRIEKALEQKRREREKVVSLVRKGLIGEEDIVRELQTIQAEVNQLESERSELFDRLKSAQETQTRILTSDAILRQLREYADLNEEEPNPEIIRLLVYGITVKDGVAVVDYAFEKRLEGGISKVLCSTHALTRV